MDLWAWLATLAAGGLAFVCLLCAGKPVAAPISMAAWGVALFTSEAALGSTGTTPGTLTAPKILPLLLLTALSAWFLLKSPQVDSVLTPPLRWAVLYVAWLACTSLFAPNPVSAEIRVVQIALPLIVIIIARRAGQRMTGYLVAAVAGCAAHVYYAVFFYQNFVGLEGNQRLTGLLIANTFGLAAGLAAAGAFGYWLGRRSGAGSGWLMWVTIGVCGYALVQSAARTAAIAILVALAACVVTARIAGAPRTRLRATLATAALIVVAFYVAFQPSLVTTAASVFIRGNNELTTLTGRIPLWQNLLTAVADHPVFGFGPSAFREQAVQLTRYMSADQAHLGVAHNALVEALVSGGVLGGLLWLAMIISLGWQASRTEARIRPATVGLYGVSAISALTTSSAAGIGIDWYIVLILAALPLAKSSLPDTNPQGVAACDPPSGPPSAPSLRQ